ncbi:MAG TPA: 3-isopropylmalate dehydrogenase [Candidatus Dormibacteraeota bacterium]|nr:3-isopropylmalate dehydrogenase [Candidatus Dormibacteraeota bacterium]
MGGPARIVVLPGDGVGPEVTRAAAGVLRAACDMHHVRIDIVERHVGGAAIDAEGAPISDATFAACAGATAILFGATGSPRWDHLTGDARPGSSLIRLRRALQLCVNLRPVRVHPGLEHRTTLRAEIVAGCDIVVVRELAGGIYYGESGRSGSGADERAFDTMAYSRAEIERVARPAFELALRRRQRLVSVDKANVLSSGRFWREVVDDVAREYPAVSLEHALVDSFALRLVQRPRDLDVILAENLLGDILSDESAALSGSIGLLPSASLRAGKSAGPALYEPVHGSAPGIAGRGTANPVGAILSVALMLEHSLDSSAGAAAVSAAVDTVIAAGVLTPDLGGTATTDDVAVAVIAAMAV